MGGHYKAQCVHGTIQRQCRCPSENKEVRTVDCPNWCPQKAESPLCDDETLLSKAAPGLEQRLQSGDTVGVTLYPEGARSLRLVKRNLGPGQSLHLTHVDLTADEAARIALLLLQDEAILYPEKLK